MRFTIYLKGRILACDRVDMVRESREDASLDRAAIDPDADRVVRKLTRAGHKAYLVGGCVRDLLVAKTPKDFDVATSATPNEIKSTFRNCRIIGRRFRLAHVFFGAKDHREPRRSAPTLATRTITTC